MTTSPSVPPKNQLSELSAAATSHETIQVAAAKPARGSRTNSDCDHERAGGAARGGAREERRRPSALRPARRRAATTAPVATNAPCASDGSPPTPTANASPVAAQREVETACEVGKPCVAEHERRERCDSERGGAERRTERARRAAGRAPRR